MNLKRIALSLVSIFFFFACSKPVYLKENSAFIVFKTPTFKYADMGFIYENKEALKVEIYGSGQALMSLNISESLVCMSRLECMRRENFNGKILSANYPKNILDNIFRGKMILKGLGLTKSSYGFTQEIIKEGKYNIHYKVLNNEIVFRDRMNKITVKVKKQ